MKTKTEYYLDMTMAALWGGSVVSIVATSLVGGTALALMCVVTTSVMTTLGLSRFMGLGKDIERWMSDR